MAASSVVRSLRAAIVFGLVGAGLVGACAARAAAAQCENWGGQPPDVGSSTNQLHGVAATSACNAWAVGYYYNSTSSVDQTLIERWNGNAWRVQSSPNALGSATENQLSAVAATSPTNAWAVGYYYNSKSLTNQTLIEHWNGKEWTLQSSPNRPGNNELSGVAATSSTDAWAVGSYTNGSRSGTLIEHWNGKTWHVQSSPSPGSSCAFAAAAALMRRAIGLSSVAATSSRNAWAVGVRCGRSAIQTLIEHWNGKAWHVKPSPNRGRLGAALLGVTATSSGNAWAVGGYAKNRTTPVQTLIEHWNGKAWKVQPSPNVGPQATNTLSDVAATSSTNAWAVGSYGALLRDPPLVERWNGKAWKIQRSSNFPNGSLFGVAATSPLDAWAVGGYYNGSSEQNLILHCC